MVSYYKNFIFKSVQNSVQTVSGIDNDCLSEIMSFILTYYSSFNQFFEDKQFLKSLLLEVRNASEDWQNILVYILENDEEYKQLYIPKIRTYYASEKLNLLNMEIYNHKFGIEKFSNWLSKAVENDHFEMFKTLIREHCENKMSWWQRMFWYSVPYITISGKIDMDKWVNVLEAKMNEFKSISNKTKRKKLEQLHFEWKSKTKTKKRLYRSSNT
eukprot:346397_1